MKKLVTVAMYKLTKKSTLAVVENKGLDALVKIVQARKSLKEATKYRLFLD